jgi:peptidoglycan/LPS O-acetylase OafA/YrhL
MTREEKSLARDPLWQKPGIRTHVPQLDGLRAIAVLLVLWTHFWGYSAGHPLINRFAAAGWIGVDLFFVLSGYLITSILWESRDKPRYYLNFYARRALRIFPIYFLLLACVFGLLPLVSTLPARLSEDAWLYALYLGNFALAAGGWQLFLVDITWSLAVEEQFYLLWPAWVRRLTVRAMVISCVAIIIATPCLRFALWDPDRWMWLHMMMPLRADAFAVGALIAVLLRQGIELPARAVMTACAPILVLLIGMGEFRRESMLVGTIGYTLTALVSGAALLLALRSRALATKPLMHVGKVSYGMYLLHPIVLVLVSSGLAAAGLDATGTAGMILQLVILTGATVAVATASFWLLESRLLALKRFFEGVPPVLPPPAEVQAKAPGSGPL